MALIRASVAALFSFAAGHREDFGEIGVDLHPSHDSDDALSLLQLNSRELRMHGLVAAPPAHNALLSLPVTISGFTDVDDFEAIDFFEEFDPNAEAPKEDDLVQPFRFTHSVSDTLHPQAIAKQGSRAAKHGVRSIQYYEAVLSKMTAVVLNIEGNWSNGMGGLTLALEVPSPCAGDGEDLWVTVDQSRCSSRYPCALRLPAQAGIRTTQGGPQPVRFRTRVVEDNEGYGTDVLRYARVNLDLESVVVVATVDLEQKVDQTRMHFNLSRAMASGSLQVIPKVIGATEKTRVTMRLRQKDVSEPRFPWAQDWRSPSSDIGGCGYRHFEVVADDLFEGPVQMEIILTGNTDAKLGAVQVASRLGLADAESGLLTSVLKAHSNFFLDPLNMIHGLPMTSIKLDDLGGFGWSNPTEWGFALTALATMAELKWLSPSDAASQISVGLETMDQWQSRPDQFSKGLFFPYYKLRVTQQKEPDYGKVLKHPHRSTYMELPCGDNALLYSSLSLVRGWLLSKKYDGEAALAEVIASKFDFSKCMHHKQCPDDEAQPPKEPRPWAVAMTVNSDTEKLFPFDWNVWADEGGVVGFAAMLSGGMSSEQFHSMVESQQMYSPCQTWQNITVANTAYFNSVFTLPTRSFLGFGTLFSSPTYHDFSIRSVLPTFRAHRATKAMTGDDYFGPSDAMSQGIGSVAFFPPNTQYKPCAPELNTANKCTWCEKLQYYDSSETHHLNIPHGGLVSFLAVATMETSQVVGWIDDLKAMMTDVSNVYNASYGFEVLGPNHRTPLGQEASFRQTARDSKSHGAGYYEALSHSYTFLSIYEGMAAVRRRYELLSQEGAEIRGPEPSPHYRPLSDFLDQVPQHRESLDSLLAVVKTHENKKVCQPSDYGPSLRHEV